MPYFHDAPEQGSEEIGYSGIAVLCDDAYQSPQFFVLFTIPQMVNGNFRTLKWRYLKPEIEP